MSILIPSKSVLKKGPTSFPSLTEIMTQWARSWKSIRIFVKSREIVRFGGIMSYRQRKLIRIAFFCFEDLRGIYHASKSYLFFILTNSPTIIISNYFKLWKEKLLFSLPYLVSHHKLFTLKHKNSRRKLSNSLINQSINLIS